MALETLKLKPQRICDHSAAESLKVCFRREHFYLYVFLFREGQRERERERERKSLRERERERESLAVLSGPGGL